MKSKLSIAFLTSTDPNNRKSWSGINFQIMKSLEQNFTNVTPIGPVKLNVFYFLLTKLVNLSNKIPFSRRFDISRSIILGKYYASVFGRRIKNVKFDLIFAPASSVEIAFLDTNIPICYFSDTSVSQIKDYYGSFSNFLKFSDKQTELIQLKALQNSDIVIHSSKWASEYVVKHYGVDKKKSFTVTMGANIDDAPNITTILSKLTNKSICNLLFLGVDWERKGGEIAFETLLELNRLGLNTHLTICGCIPPKRYQHEKMKVIPFLDKNIKEEYNKFLELMQNTHFLILPTRAECSAIVYAEASAYGIPSITTATGGVDSMVENDVNGFMLPLYAKGLDYAILIKNIFEDDIKYKKLIYSSRAKFDIELNWQVWGKRVKDIILKNYKIDDSG